MGSWDLEAQIEAQCKAAGAAVSQAPFFFNRFWSAKQRGNVSSCCSKFLQKVLTVVLVWEGRFGGCREPEHFISLDGIYLASRLSEEPWSISAVKATKRVCRSAVFHLRAAAKVISILIKMLQMHLLLPNSMIVILCFQDVFLYWSPFISS